MFRCLKVVAYYKYFQLKSRSTFNIKWHNSSVSKHVIWRYSCGLVFTLFFETNCDYEYVFVSGYKNEVFWIFEIFCFRMFQNRRRVSVSVKGHVTGCYDGGCDFNICYRQTFTHIGHTNFYRALRVWTCVLIRLFADLRNRIYY